MKYLFILGRNVDLSVAEVLAYFEGIENSVLNYSLKKNALLIEVEKSLEKNIVDKFGGVVSIGEVISSGSVDEITNDLENKILYYGTKNKLNYVLWNFASEDSKEIVLAYLKKRFRAEKLKATEKKITGLIKLQTGKNVVNVVGLVDEQYFLFEESDEGKIKSQFSSEANKKIVFQSFEEVQKKPEGVFYFGKIVERCDYEALEKRDMEKPVRRESLSISPRLAKILINLSQAKKGGKLVDPFCGIGTIIQEALIMDIQAIGIDNDPEAIQGAKKNLEWKGFSGKNYTLINDDSKKVKIEFVDVLVSEPDLGEILRNSPSMEKIEKTLKNFESLMIVVLSNFKKNVSGRFVFTAPLIRNGNKRISCNVQNILERTKLKLVSGFPIHEFREDQIVGRDIFVFEKGERV
ncbi:MAG: methyltransferase domain-containing protein [Nanoarchaeota archaeon]